MSDISRLIAALYDHGQDTAARWLQRLDGASQSALAAELAAVDLAVVAELRAFLESESAGIDAGSLEPAPVVPLPSGPEEAAAERDVAALGDEIVREDTMGIVTVAGGQGTRLGHDGPKGTYPITPVTRKSLFQHHAEKIAAARRRWRAALPWYVMTSPDNHEETLAFFERHAWFGLAPDSVRFFAQGVLPILGPDGCLQVAPGPHVLSGPDGHGGVVRALARCGLLDDMKRRGLRRLSYFQVDNPMVRIVDPRMIGYHVALGSELTSKVVARRDEKEGLGLATLAAGRPRIVEYVDVDQDPALKRRTSARGPSGELIFRFGSIAIHVIDLALIERAAAMPHGLPLHVTTRSYDVLTDPDQPGLVRKVACRKFERFVFDLMFATSRAIFMETDRQGEFAPVKRAGDASQDDTPGRAEAMMMAQWAQWLAEAGVDIREPGPDRLPARKIEIAPGFALDARELRDRLESYRPVLDSSGGPLLLA